MPLSDAASLERVLKLFLQLAEQPLSDKHDVRVDGSLDVHQEVELPPPDQLACYLRNAADIATRYAAESGFPERTD